MCVAACLCSPRQRVRPTSGDERRIKKNVDEANEEKSEEGFSRRRAPLLIARQGARPDRNQQNPRAARRSYSFFFFTMLIARLFVLDLLDARLALRSVGNTERRTRHRPRPGTCRDYLRFGVGSRLTFIFCSQNT